MSGRLKIIDELDLPEEKLAEIRRRRGVRRERWRQFEEASPHAAYQPPKDWGLQLRETQLFAALAASGGMSLEALALALYGERNGAAAKDTSIRSQITSLRRALFPFKIEIRVSRRSRIAGSVDTANPTHDRHRPS